MTKQVIAGIYSDLGPTTKSATPLVEIVEQCASNGRGMSDVEETLCRKIEDTYEHLIDSFGEDDSDEVIVSFMECIVELMKAGRTLQISDLVMPPECLAAHSGLGVPDFERSVPATGDDRPAIG